MKHTNKVVAIVKAWASKVDEKLAAEGIFADENKTNHALGEWNLLFNQPLRSARLLLVAEPVQKGLINLSWQVRFSSMVQDDPLDERRVSHIIGLCEADDLETMVAQALDDTRPSNLTQWLVTVYQVTGERIKDPYSDGWHTLNSKTLPTVALDYA